MPLSVSGLRYALACEFLWTVLSLHEYLMEDYPGYDKQVSPIFFARWSDLYTDLIDWTLDERFYPLEIERIERGERWDVLKQWDGEMDRNMFRWVDLLKTEAQKIHSSFHELNEIIWTYYEYCLFLRQVLKVFEDILRRPDSDLIYSKRFLKNKLPFTRLSEVLENELQNIEHTLGDHAVGKTLLASSETFAVLLGKEWVEAVLSATKYR